MDIRESLKKIKFTSFYLSIITVIGLTVLICMFPTCGKKATMTYKNDFYFVYCGKAETQADNFAACVTAQSYGGAGVDFVYGDTHYAVIALYYSSVDANAVRDVFLSAGKTAEILAVKKETYALATSSATKNKELYLGNLKTLYSLSRIFYECANNKEKGANADAVKECLTSASDTLNGLYKANANNCFTAHIEQLIAQCDKARNGAVSAGGLRAIQIEIADILINIALT